MRALLGLALAACLSACAVTATPPVAPSLRFDSRQLADKSPFGAVPAGTAVDFAVHAPRGVQRLTLVIERRRLEGNEDLLQYTELARVPMQPAPEGDGERWRARHAFADIGVYGYWFEAEVDGRRYALQNNTDAVPWTKEKGSNGAGVVEPLPAQREAIRRFRHTVYASDYRVPEWAADAVYYYIFPERFRNGDPSNDPKPGADTYQDHGVEFHARWIDKPYRPGSGDGSDAVYNNDFFGGDIAGIIEKLDDIAELGANTLYITPMFRAASNHKYDTADYRHIDPHFGSDDDFARLCREAAKRGIRVVPDTSLNHVGSDSIYFDRYAKHHQGGAFEGAQVRADSPYADWFSFDTTQREVDKQYKGWLGIADLPEINKASPGFRRFAYGAPDSIMKLWLDRGAAGWRMDVAPWVPDDFWREWRRAIKALRPDAITIAETWFDASKFFLGDTFDSTMNYIFRNALLDYAGGAKASVAYRSFELMREAYPPQAFHALMNLVSSHDVARGLHVLGWHEGETDRAVIARAKQRFRLAVFFQSMYPGAPTIYYGDEVGLTGGDDPYNRAPYPWADRGGQPDLALRADVKRWLALRKATPVLSRGTLQAPLLLDDHAIVLSRRLGDDWALVATSNAESDHEVRVALPAGAPPAWRDALSGERLQAHDGTLSLHLGPLSGRVLLPAAP